MLDAHVTVGRRDVDRPAPQLLAVDRLDGRERAGAVQDLPQDAGPGGRDVEHDQNGGFEGCGEVPDERRQGLDSSGGGT